MKQTWLKYACTAALAVATALPVGAQSIQTGFGEPLNLPVGIKAIDLDDLSGPEKQVNQNLEQQALNQLNQNLRTYINEHNKGAKEPYKGNAVKGTSLYQLQGSDQEGHHVGYLFTTIIDDDVLPYLESDDKKGTHENGWGLTANKTYSDKELTAVNQFIKEAYAKSLDVVAAHGQKLEKQGAMPEGFTMINMGRTHKRIDNWYEAVPYARLLGLSFHAVDVKSATTHQGYALGRGNIGLDLSYDGFKLPVGVALTAVDNGKALQVSELISIDASRPFWTHVMNQIIPASSTK